MLSSVKRIPDKCYLQKITFQFVIFRRLHFKLLSSENIIAIISLSSERRIANIFLSSEDGIADIFISSGDSIADILLS